MRVGVLSLLFGFVIMGQVNSFAQDQPGAGAIVCIGAGAALPWQGVDEINIQLIGTGPERIMSVQTLPGGQAQEYSAKLIPEPLRTHGQTFLGTFGSGLTDRQVVQQSGGPGAYPYGIESFASGQGAKLWIDVAVTNVGKGAGTFFYLNPVPTMVGAPPYQYQVTRFAWQYFPVVCTSGSPEALHSSVPAVVSAHEGEGVEEQSSSPAARAMVQQEPDPRESVRGLLSRLNVTSEMLESGTEGNGLAKLGVGGLVAATLLMVLRRTPQGLAASIAIPSLPRNESVETRIESLSKGFSNEDLVRYLKAEPQEALKMIENPRFKEFVSGVEAYLESENYNRSLSEEI
jgi:hypothetical protein